MEVGAVKAILYFRE